MIIGETLVLPDAQYQATYFSPWFPRGGNAAIFQCDLIARHNVDSFTFIVETKNTEDDDKDASSLASTSVSLTANNTRTKLEAGANLGATGSAGFKELVRYSYVLQADTGKGGFVHFRILTPAWLSD